MGASHITWAQFLLFCCRISCWEKIFARLCEVDLHAFDQTNPDVCIDVLRPPLPLQDAQLLAVNFNCVREDPVISFREGMFPLRRQFATTKGLCPRHLQEEQINPISEPFVQ